MVVKNNKIILTDCDGVLLDWEEGFTVWMEHHGHKPVENYKLLYKIGERYGISNNEGHRMVRQFNESAAIGFLPPLRDAQYFIKKLHEQHRYDFIALTSLSLDPYAQKLRERNLNKLMGGAFKKVICLDTGADKDEVLLDYKDTGCYWVEDKPLNVDTGIKLGLNGVLINHDHNKHYDGSAIRVWTWEELYKIIIGEKVYDFT